MEHPWERCSPVEDPTVSKGTNVNWAGVYSTRMPYSAKISDAPVASSVTVECVSLKSVPVNAEESHALKINTARRDNAFQSPQSISAATKNASEASAVSSVSASQIFTTTHVLT